MALGPVMVDLAGTELSQTERGLLAHPGVGGVILFSRNYESPAQLEALCASLHALREPKLLVAVDHEGGRVQRFRDGFTRLPSMARLGELYERDPQDALGLARDGGWLMSAELLTCGVDLSFAPVLDLDRARSRVIADRAFGDDPDVVTSLARAWIRGMREAGMAAVGKHFPGHGGVSEDSHEVLPRDARDLATLRLRDMVPFERLAGEGLPAIMTAHLQVEAVDDLPVSFSRIWITEILRGSLGFTGAVFSDDLSMHATACIGNAPERADAALRAGCDMVLVCNDAERAAQVVEAIGGRADVLRAARLTRLHGRTTLTAGALRAHPRHAATAARLERLERAPELDLHDDNPA